MRLSARPSKRMDCCVVVAVKIPSGASSSLARGEVASQRHTVRPLRHGSQPVQRSMPCRLVRSSMRGIPPKYLSWRIRIVIYARTVFGHGLDPCLAQGIILQCPGEPCPRMCGLADFERQDLSAVSYLVLDLRTQVAKCLLARGAFRFRR